MAPAPMLLVTTPTVPGYTFVAVIGMVATPMLSDPETAMANLWSEASGLGANAVVGASLVFAAITHGASGYSTSSTKFVATGTAVIVAPIDQGEPGWTPQSASQVMR